MSESSSTSGLSSPDSPEYQLFSSEVSKIRKNVSIPFGAREILKMDNLTEPTHREIILASLRTQLLEHAGNPVWEYKIGNLIDEVSVNPEISRQMKALTKFQLPDNKIDSTLFQNGIMPDHLLEEIVKEHLRSFEKKSRTIEQRAKNIISDFHSRAQVFALSRVIPLTPADVNTRLAQAKVTTIDPLHYGKRFIFGIHEAISHDILISSDIGIDQLRTGLSHELTHVLAGRTFLATPHRQYIQGLSEVDYPINQHIQRSGTVIRDYTGDQPRRRYDWLNEGITDTIQINLNPEFIGTPLDTNYYHEEKEILAFLQEKCGSLDPFLAAYFEDYDSSTPRDERLKGWKRMKEITDHVFEPGFLAAMDRYVREHGIEKAHATLYQNWRKII